MAVSFNKEFILEAIQEVLAEAETVKKVIGPKGGSIAQAVSAEEEKELKKAGAKIEPMEEETLSVGHIDDEPGMLKQFAFDTAEYAVKLYKLLREYEQMEEQVDFPNWWQHKVMMAREYISKATHYLEFETMEPQIDAAVDGHSEEELAEGDYQARTKEDLVFQYLRDAWQFGATKGRDVNPDEELSTMADSLLANLPDYDAAEKAEKPKEKSAFEKRLEKLAAAEKERRANLKEDTLDEIKKAEFEKIKPGKELQLRGYGVVTVVANDGIVMKIKDSLDKVHTINLGQYNEKFLKEDDDVEPSKKDIKAAEKDVKNVSDDKKQQFNRALAFIKKFKDNPGAVAGMLKKAKEEYKLPKNLLKDLARAAQVSETLAEGVSCCGRCGRVHESAQDCKKPYISKDSPRHCKNKK